MPADAPTLPDLLRRQARSRTDHPLLICDEERLSYADADRRSARLARSLLALGVGKGTHIGLLYPNGARFVVGALAAVRIGAVAVPFSTFATAAELRGQLRDSDVAVLLAAPEYRSHDYRQRLSAALETDELAFDSDSPSYLGQAPVLRHVIFNTDRLDRRADRISEAALTAVEAGISPADPLAIVYTSGSTGAPKGAMHTHGGLIEHQQNLNAVRALSSEDVLFCNSPFFWIGGFAFGLLASLAAGSTLLCSNATDAAATLDLLEAEKPTVGNGFAAGIAHLAEHPSFARRDLSTLRRGNLYPLMPADVRPADPALRHNMLGMTEAGSVVLLDGDESDQPEHRRGSHGRPAPGFETKVVNAETGIPVPVGEPGELCLRGRYLMRGYYGRSREECFDRDGWFHTGDLVRVDAEGYFYYLGRTGAMIKTSGANVTPTEVADAVSNALRGWDIEGQAYVVGLPDPVRGQLVAAVIAHDHTSDLDEAALRRVLRAELSAYKVPKRFVQCRPADVPLLSSGKVDLPALARMFDA